MKTNKWMKMVIALLCVMTMMITFVACGNNSGSDDTSQKGSETESQKETGSQTESEDKNQTESEVESETETETDSESGTYTDTEGVTDTESETEEATDSEENTNAGNDATGSDEGDVLGEGSESQPYLETPIVDGDIMTVTTVAIGAGKSVYYDIYRVGGMILKIQNTNAYVEYNGKTYEAKNGVVSFEIENSMASAPISFKIGNKGNASATFVIQFSNPTGSYMNPIKISSFENSYSLHVDAGNEVGHYYKYTAEKAGTITFYISELTSSTKNAKAFISVTNNNTYANRTTDADGTKDGDYVKVSIEVSAGDELMIQVGASPTSTWKYPAEDIVWVAQYQ